MNAITRVLSLAAAALLLAACNSGSAGTASSAYSQEVLDWRETRRASLLSPTGYLNQIGLHWLSDGVTTFGSDAGNDIVLPLPAAPHIGTFSLQDGVVTMTVNEGVDVTLDGGSQSTMVLRADTDTSGPEMVLNHTSLAWSLIERAGRFAVRFRNYEHPFAKSFGVLPYFDIDPLWRLDAKLQRYPEPRIANVATVIEGLPYNPSSPGVVTFEIAGADYELEAYTVGERLFFVFGDLTNRDDTYGAGRFLYAKVPGDDGATVLDFNQSYSPPCAFNDFSTCPVASPRNRLNVRIEAGEKYDPALHYTGD